MNLSEQDVCDRNEQEPEAPAESEKSEHLTRETYKDGHIEWRFTGRILTDCEQDRFEEAYELGFRAGDHQGYNRGFNEAYGKGAVDAARAAYGGGNG